MVSRGTVVTAVSILVAAVLWYWLSSYTEAPDWALWAVLIGVGVLLPSLVRERL
jgi:predicted PurR-regulated permease PerM